MKFLPQRLHRVGMSPRVAMFILTLDTMAWGLSYVVIKIGAAAMPPFELIALRFTIASLICTLLFRDQLRQITRRGAFYGVVLGITMFIGSTTMAYGVLSTTASTATFLASAKIVFVPLLLALWTRKLPAVRMSLCFLGTMVGIGLLSLEDGLNLSLGAILCILSALSYAFHIIFTGEMAKRENAVVLGVVQQITMAILGWVGLALFNTPVVPTGFAPWAAVLTLALVNGVFVFVSRSVAPAHASSEHTALLFALEPVFGAIFSYLLMHDTLDLQDALGAAIILLSVLLASTKKKSAPK